MYVKAKIKILKEKIKNPKIFQKEKADRIQKQHESWNENCKLSHEIQLCNDKINRKLQGLIIPSVVR